MWANILFTIEHRWHKCLNFIQLYTIKMLCTKLANFKLYACSRSQNSWVGNLYHCLTSPLLLKKQFEDVWTSRLWVLEFCCWNWRFVVIFEIFCLMMHQMFSICERSGLQAGQLAHRAVILQSHAVVIAAVCGFALSCWIHVLWREHILL